MTPTESRQIVRASPGPCSRSGWASWDLLVLLVLGLACVSGLVLLARLGDYPGDAGPAVAALAAGSLRRAAAVPFLMGPFSIVLRAPFAWVAQRAGLGELGIYRAGILPCLAATAALGVALARTWPDGARDRARPLLIPILAILTPASLAAVQNGHPEEALGGALAVGAVLLAIERRPGWAAVALGLAVATKQWALLAVVPAMLAAAPRVRVRLAITAALTAAVFYVPFVAQNPHAFAAATRIEAHVESAATPETIWLLVSHPRHIRVGSAVITSRAIAKWIPPASHSLIILLAVPFGVALWRRRPCGAAPLALLALLFLARCVFDPVDLDYFHLPFVLALLAWEVKAGRVVRGLPVVTLAVVLCLWLTFSVLHADGVNLWLIDATYLAWTSVVAVYLLGVLGLIPFTLRRLSGGLAPAGR